MADSTARRFVAARGAGGRFHFVARARQAELVQPRRLPDGLLEVRFADQAQDDLFILEIATYPDARVHEQITHDLAMVWLALQRLPETIVLVLRPRGRVRVKSEDEWRSRLGLTSLRTSWRVVEMWNVPAAELFAAGDVGLMPLVPLANFTGPPQPVLRQCRERIEDQAAPNECANLLAVTQVMTRLRFPEQTVLLNLLGGSQAMIESPLIQEIEAKAIQGTVLDLLESRFKNVPEDIRDELADILDTKRLRELNKAAATSKDLRAFRKRLSHQS